MQSANDELSYSSLVKRCTPNQFQAALELEHTHADINWMVILWVIRLISI